MTANVNLKDVVALLQSDKVKERQEGLSKTKDTFQRPQALDHIDLGETPTNAWLSIFQGLFKCVVSERDVARKRNELDSHTTATRRLQDAVSVVRWMVERTRHRINSKVMAPLVTHILATIKYKKKLLKPVALDYVKILRSLYSFSPHLDRIPPDTWISLVSLSFAVVSNVPLSLDLAEESVVQERDGEEEPPEHVMSEMDVDGRSGTPKRARSTQPDTSRKRARHNSSSLSIEQVEFMGLLTNLMRGPPTALLADPLLTHNVLEQFYSFFTSHPSDTSAHYDAVSALNHLLRRLDLNARTELTEFGVRIWDPLLALWGTKNKSMKDEVVLALQLLFPYVTLPEEDGLSASGLRKLQKLLDREAESRWGANELSLDHLRLEASDAEALGPFELRCFRYGYQFDASHALAWAILDLQAGCIAKLLQIAEFPPVVSQRGAVENPLIALLGAISASPNQRSRTHRLQTLAFVVDRHWSTISETLRQDVLDKLSQYLGYEEPGVQSWVFICIAEIASVDGSNAESLSSAVWENLWAHATRRLSSPQVGRAACLVAHAIVLHKKIPSQRLLAELETLGRDLDVQGPPYPYDSVCAFLAQCLRIAGQDMRLYRLQLEDKVLSWLVDSWNVTDGMGQTRSTMPANTVRDILMLLEVICGIPQRSDLVCRRVLPESAIVSAMIDEHETLEIKNYLLYARLPSYRQPESVDVHHATPSPTNMQSSDMDEPSPRARKISTFLLRCLQMIIHEWEKLKEAKSSGTALMVRRCIDIAVVAITFEASLSMNCITPNRKVLQAASKILCTLAPSLTERRWSSMERCFIVLGVEPLVSVGDQAKTGFEIMLPPGPYTGVKYNPCSMNTSEPRNTLRDVRRRLQSLICQASETRDAFTALSASLRAILTSLAKQGLNPTSTSRDDGFGSFVTETTQHTEMSESTPIDLKVIADVCITFLVVTPILFSSTQEPTRDRSLASLLTEGNTDSFLFLSPIFFDHVRVGNLMLSVDALHDFLVKMGNILPDYWYARADRLLLAIIQMLQSTTTIWLPEVAKEAPAGVKAYQLVAHLCRNFKANAMQSWKARDALIRFCDAYLAVDPLQNGMMIVLTQVSEEPPIFDISWDEVPDPNMVELIPTGNADADIRVRIRAATASAHLFSKPEVFNYMLLSNPGVHIGMAGYDLVKKKTSQQIDDMEAMITRLLCLGNITVVSSAVRRGSYWHLLETSFHDNGKYEKHLEALLRSVSDRMGLARFSELFETHASQIAWSLRLYQKDFLRLPPNLLGFATRKDAAQAVFRPISLVNLLALKSSKTYDEGPGWALFTSHCVILGKEQKDGLQEVFADVAGARLVSWIDKNGGDLDHFQMSQEISEELHGYMDSLVQKMRGGEVLSSFVQRCGPDIVVSVLRTLGDLDHTPEGLLSDALRRYDETGKQHRLFRSLVRFRSSEVVLHDPNSPAYSTFTVLSALRWLFNNHQDATFGSAAFYHVLHALFQEASQTPIINEQIRFLNAICLWVSLNENAFQESSVLRTFISGTMIFLDQPTLVLAVQSMLDWALRMFKYYSRRRAAEARLPDMLIRIASMAAKLCSQVDQDVAKLGREMLVWFEGVVVHLASTSHLGDFVAQALATWPLTPGDRLASIMNDLPHVDVTQFFRVNDRTAPSTQFRLVHRLLHGHESTQVSRENFAREAFWSLKNCIPKRDLLDVQDVSTFASLLIQHAGRVSPFANEKAEISYLRGLHIEYGKQIKSAKEVEWVKPTSPPKRSIILALLSRLHSSEWLRGHLAYTTLRALLSVTSLNNLVTKDWDDDEKTELRYLHKFPEIAQVRSAEHLPDWLQSEKFRSMAKDFSSWVIAFGGLLCDVLGAWDPFYGQLLNLLQSDPSFASDILPILVHTVLWARDEHPEAKKRDDAPPWKELLSEYFHSIIGIQDVDHQCIQAILGVMLHMRNFTLSKTDALSSDKWLLVDYKRMSEAAITCGAYTTALLFLELSAEYQVNESERVDAQTAENILHDIYRHIGEPDGFYGIKNSNWRQFILRRFHHEQQWDKAFQFHGANLEAGNVDSFHLTGILQSLHAFGFDKLAINTLRHPPASLTDEASIEMSYRLGWRSEVWDLPEQPSVGGSEVPLYNALRAVYRERDAKRVSNVVHTALLNEADLLRSLGNENLVQIRRVSRSLMCLAQVVFWTESPAIQNGLCTKQLDLHAWATICDVDTDLDFEDRENIMATRIALVRSARQREERDLLGSLKTPFWRDLVAAEQTSLLRLSSAAREAGDLQIALNTVTRAQELVPLSFFELSQNYADVLWEQKEQNFAIGVLTDALQKESTAVPTSPVRRATLLARLGTWTAEARLERPRAIKNRYFDPAVKLLEGQAITAAHVPLFRQYATFAERQYQAIVKSPDVMHLRVFIERKKKEIEHRKHTAQQQRSQDPEEVRKAAGNTAELRKAQLLLEEDETQLKYQTLARQGFLDQALDMLSRCLGASEEDNLHEATRFVSLWFVKENFENDVVTKRIRHALTRIPTRNFVFLAHQLSARLSQKEGEQVTREQANLHALVQQLCREHPFQCLPQVFCVRDETTKGTRGLDRNGSGGNVTDGSTGTGPRRSGRVEEKDPPSVYAQRDRAHAARQIFAALAADANVQRRVRAVEVVCRAALNFAEYDRKKLPDYSEDKKRKGLDFALHPSIALAKLKDMDVPVLTIHLPPDPTLKYDNCVWITKYAQRFTFATGVNVPKVINCRGSDGLDYKQLFKGEQADDLRQDAVMKQVFDLVNLALRRDRETRKRELIVRTYKIIPLASKAGLLEFVSETIPMRNWLFNAHKVYRPQDTVPQECTNILERATPPPRNTSHQERVHKLLPVFQDVRHNKIRPVMRHYYYEQSKVPTVWFARRLAYGRSVATTSIVGHVLGLGDRHTSNILLSNTGEVIHIDFGIAFDQGKLLPVPERVPFRMTEDMIDALGISGTQGVFQRCAQETLRVLRDDSEIIMSVLEVLKYDPLYSWTASEVKLKKVQGKGGTSADVLLDTAQRFGGLNIDLDSAMADEAAERALNSVARKLDKGLTVEYVVNELLAEATDEVNLATIYYGWGAFL